ncbi:Translation initiation factor eIF3, subunit M [Chondrus crispus]|uniref:Eukaryotic translation initiation factor 3 subunit M n=1 Tax=Chondrus crispus TaxID=2769 RepID=R7QKJ6_CHOCR|nr:Translation initiation factor eIF3, subunit M [Chondrus crispus]CDF38303.1 Translation initiation factor eIF3, subunit M [Chondrus crispus]|eukprot:XP_005718188.1 Translation initiation factor eIF3, subunit M [Chondrus crispus]
MQQALLNSSPPPTELAPVDPSSAEEKASSCRELLLAAEYLESKTSTEGLTARIDKAVASGADALSATDALADAFLVALDLPIDDFDSLEGCMQVVLMWLKKECAMNSQLVHKISDGLCKGVKPVPEGGKSQDPRDQLRLKCMALLYNSVSEDNVDERFSLLVSTISLATKIRMVSKIVDTVLPKIDAFMRQWDRDVPEKRLMYKVSYEALRSDHRMEQAFAFNVKHLELYNGAAEEEFLSVEDATIDVIVQAVRLEKLYRFDTLLELDAVKRFGRLQADHKLLFELISIFVRHDLAVFTDFRAKNEALLAKYEIDVAVAEKKMRLLTFASLGIDSQDLTYGMIAKALQISEDEVEDWVIRAIGSGLVDAKINQLTSSVSIYRSTQRMFTREEWQPLSERINIWKENIGDLLANLRETRQSSTTAAVEAFSG